MVLPDTETLNVIRERIEGGQYSLTETDTGFSVTGPDEIQVQFRVCATFSSTYYALLNKNTVSQ